jgi:hypothetical protein
MFSSGVGERKFCQHLFLFRKITNYIFADYLFPKNLLTNKSHLLLSGLQPANINKPARALGGFAQR